MFDELHYVIVSSLILTVT